MKTEVRDGPNGDRYLLFWCQGCDTHHMVRVTPPGWTWNGDRERPTIEPSVRVSGGLDGGTLCHLFLRAGRLEFLSDSAHRFAGQTLDLADYPAAD